MATYQYDGRELIMNLCKGIQDEADIVNFIEMIWRGEKREKIELAKLKWFQIVNIYRTKKQIKALRQGEIDIGLVIAFRVLEKILKNN